MGGASMSGMKLKMNNSAKPRIPTGPMNFTQQYDWWWWFPWEILHRLQWTLWGLLHKTCPALRSPQTIPEIDRFWKALYTGNGESGGFKHVLFSPMGWLIDKHMGWVRPTNHVIARWWDLKVRFRVDPTPGPWQDGPPLGQPGLRVWISAGVLDVCLQQVDT